MRKRKRSPIEDIITAQMLDDYLVRNVPLYPRVMYPPLGDFAWFAGTLRKAGFGEEEAYEMVEEFHGDIPDIIMGLTREYRIEIFCETVNSMASGSWGLDSFRLGSRGYLWANSLDYPESEGAMTSWKPADDEKAYRRCLAGFYKKHWSDYGLPPFRGEVASGSLVMNQLLDSILSSIFNKEDNLYWLSECLNSVLDRNRILQNYFQNPEKDLADVMMTFRKTYEEWKNRDFEDFSSEREWDSYTTVLDFEIIGDRFGDREKDLAEIRAIYWKIRENQDGCHFKDFTPRQRRLIIEMVRFSFDWSSS